MAREGSTPLTDVLTSVLCEDHVLAEGKRLGVFTRRPRRLRLFVLVWSVLLGLPVGAKRLTLEGLRRAYQKAAGHTLARSSFHDRLNPALTRLFKDLVHQLLAAPAADFALPDGALAGFRDILAFDATVLRLHDLLAKRFAATRTNHTKAAAKLHMVLSVLAGTPRKVKLTAERVGDTVPWKRLGPWVSGCLLLFDLGYYSFHLFDRIDQNGGFFLSRAKSNFNPVITATHRRWRGQAIDVVGQRLQDVLPRLARAHLDVQVEVSFSKRAYKGKSGRKKRTFRLVATKNVETGQYHLYLTNLPADRLSAEEVCATYAVRWQIELFFKLLRSHLFLSDLPTTKPHIVELLVWASILRAIISGELFRLIRRLVRADRHIPLLRWGRLFAEVAHELLHLINHLDPKAEQQLLKRLLHEAPDPSRRRSTRSIQEVPMPVAY